MPLSPWTQISSLPFVRSGHEGLDFDDAFWLIGGWTDSRTVLRSIDVGVTWADVGTDALPAPVVGHSAVSFLDTMWVMGGLNTDDFSTTDKIYASTDGTWTEVGTLPAPRSFAACAVFGGYVWLIAGFDGSNPVRTVWRSADGLTWEEVGTDVFPLGLQGHRAVVFADALWVTGGYVALETSQKVFRSEDGETWAEVGTDALPLPVTFHGMAATTDQLWVIGGQIDTFTATTPSVSHSFGGAWFNSARDEVPVALGYPAVIVRDDRLYVFGGYDQAVDLDVAGVYAASLVATAAERIADVEAVDRQRDVDAFHRGASVAAVTRIVEVV